MKYKSLHKNDSIFFSAEITANPESRSADYALQFSVEHCILIDTLGSRTESALDLSKLEEVSSEIQEKVAGLQKIPWKSIDLDKLEGEICGVVHRSLKNVPTEILDDPSFWRFLSIRYFSDFILFREKTALKAGNIGKYFLAENSAESIPLRLYIRAQAVMDDKGGYALAEAVPKGTDFWRSHIIRVRTGRAQALAQSFAQIQSTQRMNTNLLREVARGMNRRWSNVLFFDYDRKEATRLITEVKNTVNNP